MRGIRDYTAIDAEPPPSGKKRCTVCRQYKPIEYFSTNIHKLADGTKKRYWRGRCNTCHNESRRGKSTSTWWKEEALARDKAATRLIQAAPSVFLPLFVDELQKQYKRMGLTEPEAEARLGYRTRFVKEYIKRLGD